MHAPLWPELLRADALIGQFTRRRSVHFGDGVLAGLKLVGFAVWARRDGAGNSVSFPARPFVVHGERRNFALLRAVQDRAAQQPLRELVLEAYEAEASAADALVAED